MDASIAKVLTSAVSGQNTGRYPQNIYAFLNEPIENNTLEVQEYKDLFKKEYPSVQLCSFKHFSTFRKRIVEIILTDFKEYCHHKQDKLSSYEEEIKEARIEMERLKAIILELHEQRIREETHLKQIRGEREDLEHDIHKQRIQEENRLEQIKSEREALERELADIHEQYTGEKKQIKREHKVLEHELADIHEQRIREENRLEQIKSEREVLEHELADIHEQRIREENRLEQIKSEREALEREIEMTSGKKEQKEYVPAMPKHRWSWFLRFSRQEKVYSSVFAQAEMERDKHMFVLVYLHTLKETEELLSLAQEVHPDVERRDNIPLSCRLKRGDKVDVCLYIRGKQTLYNKKKSITWQGTKTKCVFDYLIPENLEEKELSSQIILLTNGVPIGEMWFVTKITNNPCTLNPEVFSKPFKKVFISYSHKDIKIVQHLAEGFRLLKLDYFFDRHNLKPGDVYPEKIQKYIQSADVFVLYWSQNAKESNYVTQEISWALPLAYPQVHPQTESTLTIYPISIEPRATFPKELQENYDYIEL